MEQLGSCATTAEPVLWSLRAMAAEARKPQLLKPARLGPVLRNGRGHCSEARAPQRRVAPRLLQVERACAQQRRSNVAENN